MKCIVGLGNIGKRFELTKHNIGFEVIDYMLERNQFKLDKQKYKGAYTIERLAGEKVMFIEPMTMMNCQKGSFRDYRQNEWRNATTHIRSSQVTVYRSSVEGKP